MTIGLEHYLTVAAALLPTRREGPAMPRVVCAGHVNWDVTLYVDALPEADGEARLTLELPHEADARTVYAMLTERYPDTSLVAYRERERPARTRRGLESAIDGRLTERQRKSGVCSRTTGSAGQRGAAGIGLPDR